MTASCVRGVKDPHQIHMGHLESQYETKNQYTPAYVYQLSPLYHTAAWEQAHIYSRTNVLMIFSMLCKCWIIKVDDAIWAKVT